MRLRTFIAMVLVASGSLLTRPGLAAGEVAAQKPSTLTDDVAALRRDLLLLVSAGLSRLGMWKGASVVSRHLAQMADDPLELCLAQAAVVWQTTEAGPFSDVTYKEWQKLRDSVDRVGADDRFAAGEKEECRVGYRRVSGNLIYSGILTSDLGRRSLQQIRVVSAAYQVAVQQGVAADGAAPRR